VNPSRRDLLAAATAAGAVAAMSGCEKIISTATERFGQSVPDSVEVPSTAVIDPAHHLLSRAAYGPWPGDIETVRSAGPSEWIEQQLHPESIDDKLCDLRARRFEELEEPAGECFEYKKPILRQEMARKTLLRALYSKRQLFEVMVSFWTDHLNINIEKGDCIYLKPTDDREVIRKHALGKFRDLIRASATSAAMLVYLDGNQNSRGVPNENYGRELMELHTLGVDGGYTQHDVYQAARALTGWRIRRKFRRGTVYFDASLHDPGEKSLLGTAIPAGGGEADVDAVVDIVCSHPSTSRHIATKLVRRFVSDEPPQSLVEQVADAYRRTDGDIKTMLRTIFLSEEFKASVGTKFKSPFMYVVSALRAAGADTHAHAPLIEYLTRMGQGVFEYPTPDGYPDKTSPWLGSLLWRWNFAFALASGKLPTVTVSREKLFHALGIGTGGQGSEGTLFRYFAGRLPNDDERTALESVAMSDGNERIGMMLASPQFQWH
jgi:uncharacterized protein (DUF1800 family)